MVALENGMPNPTRRDFLAETAVLTASLACNSRSLASPSGTSETIDDYIQQNKERWLTEDYIPFLRVDLTSAKQGEDLTKKTQGAAYLEELLLHKGFSPKVFIGTDTPGKERLHHLVETGLPTIRPIVYFEMISDSSLPTVVFDTHYDGRPVNDNPKDSWKTNPFEPVRKKVTEEWNNGTIQDERIYARRACDSAGHVMSIIWALEAYQKVYGKLPVNVKIMFEGAEEIGSPGMDKFVEKYKDLLQADLVVIDDSWTNKPGIPIITERLRGSLSGEIYVQTAVKEGHSGSGSYLPNALGFLARIMDRLADPITKKVALSSYTDTIPWPTPAEVDYVDKLQSSWTEEERKAAYGAKALVGDSRYSATVRTILLPSWDWEKVSEGKVNEGVIASQAGISFKTRLAHGQQPQAIFAELERWLQQQPEAQYATITAKMTSGYPAFRANLDNKYTTIIRGILQSEFGSKECEIDWSGAGEPIASYFQSILGIPVFHIGFGDPKCKAHGTNESMLVNYGLLLGIRVNARIMNGLKAVGKLRR